MADARKFFRQVHRADKNQAGIVEFLRRFGVRVWITSQVGGGGPDLVASKDGQTVLLEIKRPGGKLRDAQERFHRNWDGPIYTVETGQQALDIILAHIVAAKPWWQAAIDRAHAVLAQVAFADRAQLFRIIVGGGDGHVEPAAQGDGRRGSNRDGGLQPGRAAVGKQGILHPVPLSGPGPDGVLAGPPDLGKPGPGW